MSSLKHHVWLRLQAVRIPKSKTTWQHVLKVLPIESQVTVPQPTPASFDHLIVKCGGIHVLRMGNHLELSCLIALRLAALSRKGTGYPGATFIATTHILFRLQQTTLCFCLVLTCRGGGEGRQSRAFTTACKCTAYQSTLIKVQFSSMIWIFAMVRRRPVYLLHKAMVRGSGNIATLMI